MLINSLQLSAAVYLYDPFGNELASSGRVADQNVYRFSSKESHSTSGLTYYLFRYYDASPQRWVNRDPIEESGGDNLFTFVRNDPTRYVDALGLGRICLIKKMLVTAYATKGPGSDWSYFKTRGSVGPGTVAVANYSSDSGGPTTPATPYYEYGSDVTVYGSDGQAVYTGVVHDTGAGWDAAHHNEFPEDWIDIWKPAAQAKKFGKQRLKVKICHIDPCAKTDETIDLTGGSQ